MPTLEEMRVQTRSHLDEQTERFWDDASEIDVWIHEAARDIARRAEVLSDTYKITLKTDQDTYDFPPDLLRIHRVEYHQSTANWWPLEFRPILQMDDIRSRSNVSGTPSCYTSWGFTGGSQQLILDRSSSEAGVHLVIYYYRLPRKPTADTDTVEVPAGWEDLIPLYAEYVARRKDNDQRWKEAHDLYQSRLQEMIRTTRFVSDQETFFSPGWLSEADWG